VEWNLRPAVWAGSPRVTPDGLAEEMRGPAYRYRCDAYSLSAVHGILVDRTNSAGLGALRESLARQDMNKREDISTTRTTKSNVCVGNAYKHRAHCHGSENSAT